LDEKNFNYLIAFGTEEDERLGKDLNQSYQSIITIEKDSDKVNENSVVLFHQVQTERGSIQYLKKKPILDPPHYPSIASAHNNMSYV